jgi:hypothetical protein
VQFRQEFVEDATEDLPVGRLVNKDHSEAVQKL